MLCSFRQASCECKGLKTKENGVTKEEMAEILTQLAFYSGWPKAWAAFRMAKVVYENNEGIK